MATARTAKRSLLGPWRIVETDVWDVDDLDATDPADLTLEPNGHGRLGLLMSSLPTRPADVLGRGEDTIRERPARVGLLAARPRDRRATATSWRLIPRHSRVTTS
jgi:hypothetical protein